ncbi:alpha/beta fold hydrolase [Lutibacter sp. B2]|nr:alpha/beta fold hydrolase [Lutibacter sp. B2]
MKANTNKYYRPTKIILILLLSILLVSVITMSFTYYKVSNSLIHREKEIQIQVSLNPKEFSWEEVVFKSKKDNLTLKGTFFYAKTPSNKTLIFVHGFDENRRMSGRTKILIEYLIPRGYNVLAFDLRGQGESQGDLISFGCYEKYDVLGAIDYLKQRGKIGEKIALIGFSMGAVASIETAGADSRVDALIADSAFRDLKLFIMDDINTLPNNLNTISNNLGDLSYWSILRHFPFKNKILILLSKIYGVNINEASPINTVKHIPTKPIFLIHSKNDHVIPYTNSVAIFNLVKNNSNATFWFTEKACHVGSLKMYSKE